MTPSDAELNEYVGVVRRLLSVRAASAADPDGPETVAALRRALADADVLSLAVETAGLGDSLRWLTATVAEIARVTPSLAFAVAAHYTACRGARAGKHAEWAGASGSTGVRSAPSPAVVPTVLDPAFVVLLD